MINDPIKFQPVRLTEGQLNDIRNGNHSSINGSMFMTTDTQKIYMGIENGQILPMSGNIDIFYANKEIEYPDDGNKPNPEVVFSLGETSDESEIYSNRLPVVDDLILNIDGCFYKVIEILDETSVLTNRITLQGTGTGGGGGGGSDVGGSFTIARVGNQAKYYSSSDEEIMVGFIARSNDIGNYVSMVEGSFNKDFSDIFYIEENLTHPLEQLYEFDLISQKKYFGNNSKRVYIRVTDKYGVQRSTYYDIVIATLTIQTTVAPMIQVKETKLQFNCSLEGNAGITNRIIEYKFFNEQGVEIPEYFQSVSVSNSETTVVKELDVSQMQHGTYEMQVTLHGTIGGVTTIYSNTLVHKLIRYSALVNTPIFTYLLPASIEQYIDIPVQYMLSYGNEEKTYNLTIYVNEDELTSQVITTGKIETYTFSFDRAETYKINFVIETLGVTEEFDLVVAEYSGVLPVINIDRDDLKVYLTAKGHTNNNVNKAEWPDYKNNDMKGSLTNFYFGNINGWLKDTNGVDCLKMTSGAQMLFDDYHFFEQNPKNTGMTFELDFKISGVLDYNQSLIECISRAKDGTISSGFQVFGDEFKIHAAGAWMDAAGNAQSSNSMNLVENQRIRLSYVVESNKYEDFPMCYIYLNGILSYVNTYNKENAIFQDTYTTATLKLDSTYAEIDVYNIRFYQSALNAQTILNNYQASLGTLEERQLSYDSNLIRDINGAIDLEKIESGTYNLSIPYVKIIGGYRTGKDFKMAAAADNNVQALPSGANAKKDYRAIDIEIHYPTEQQNPYFRGYEDFVLKTTFDDPSLNVLNGFGEMPNTGAMMYAQGTSSLEYPVKNLRVKTKGAKIKVRPDLESVKLICFKADYMESSGSHNTGAANFIDDVYVANNMSTPGQDYYKDETIVTCIKGHPCVIFWSKTGEPGTYEYIGKYNLNLDKGTPEPFGFKNDENNPDSKFGYLTNEDGEYVDYDGNLVSQENRVNSIFCFEFLDNAVQVCNFLPYRGKDLSGNEVTDWNYEQTWYNKVLNADNEEAYGWTIGFESRYPEDKVGEHDADALYDMASWINELANLYGIAALKGESTEVPDTRALALTRFKNEYTRYFNKEFLLAYYVITNTLLMADSRVKNMMIATWGKERCTWTNQSGETVQDYNWIWYPIFYDMDTMLGLDNTGAPNKYYYQEDTEQSLFNGDEILWVFVREALESEVARFHSQLEQNGAMLTTSGILPYFNANQANMANETFYNEDAIYKYINPFRTGYRDDLNEEDIAPGASDKLYAAQGDRSMMREYFISNRTRYLRGRYVTSAYQGGDRIEFRVQTPSNPFSYSYYKYVSDSWELVNDCSYEDANYKIAVLLNGESDNILLDSIDNPQQNQIVCILRCNDDNEETLLVGKSNIAVPGSRDFNLTSLSRGYLGVKVGQNGVPTVQYFDEKESKTISVDSSSANGTEAYILGLSNITDLGDLSNKYLQNFVIKTGDPRLERLVLGNHHKDYYNPNLRNMTTIGLGDCKYLRYFNMENCSSFVGNIDFSNCTVITNILLNGSNITGITLPKSSIIEELRLPTTITTLSIDSQPYLNDNGFTIGQFNYLNEQEGSFENDYSKLLRINIRNTPIDTFTMAKEALRGNLDSYCLQGIDWEISNEEDFIIEDNELKGLKILSDIPDFGLRSIKVYTEDESLTLATSLTGKITVKAGDLKINEYNLYQMYNSIFPNLTIVYESTGLESASTIEFYNTDSVIGQPYYSVLTDGSKNLQWLTSEDGPIGEALSEPKKQSTASKDYIFNGRWKVAASEDSQFVVGSIINQSDFENYITNGNIKFVAQYDEADRLYEVILYDYDGSTILIQDNLKYEDDIGEVFKDNSKSYYNYRVYNGTKENYRYEFRGWQSEWDYNNSPTTLTYSTLVGKKVNSKLKLYAYYAEENCLTTVSNSDYFEFTSNATLKIKDKYKSILAGKLTLPSKNNLDQPLLKIAENFLKENKNIEEIYFLEDAKYTEILNESFYSCEKLTQIYNLPNTITTIGMLAFQRCFDLHLDKLPDNLINLGLACFAFDKNICLSVLPNNLTKVENLTFLDCTNLLITEFGTENSGASLTLIGDTAFSNAGKTINGDITIGNNLSKVLLEVFNTAFNGYGNKINTLYVKNNVSGNPPFGMEVDTIENGG